ncbi:MAG: elongation factor P--(R)-beta-lysine ligase [Planctomycetales bacterium]|nr:elongation factor P--(R)-beta-lysine ligase [Planctomycetales bacterium]
MFDSNSPAWQPSTSIANVKRRAELLWTIREFFHRRGVLEVQTPILSRDVIIDRHIDPVCLSGASLALADFDQTTFYLQTSPEFCMKRLMAAGLSSIYEITPVFRAGERGAYHNPEFTMLEWYVVGADFQHGVDLLAELIVATLSVESVEQLSYQAAFQHTLGCDPLEATNAELSRLAVELRLNVAEDWSDERDEWLNLLFSERVQPHLGKQRPTIVTHYPATQAALARLCPRDSRTAERYELFIDGVALANGYHKLLDADELERRNEQSLAQRSCDGKPLLPTHSRLVDAMRSGLPACSGCALGLDRLLMVALAASSIDEVLPFPIERA